MAMETGPLRELLELQAERKRLLGQVGPLVRELRNQRGVSQTVMAAALNVSQAYLSQVESGNRTPSSETVTSIVNYFGTTEGATHAQDKDPNQEDT